MHGIKTGERKNTETKETPKTHQICTGNRAKHGNRANTIIPSTFRHVESSSQGHTFRSQVDELVRSLAKEAAVEPQDGPAAGCPDWLASLNLNSELQLQSSVLLL